MMRLNGMGVIPVSIVRVRDGWIFVSSTDDRATIEAIMTAVGKVTAIGIGTFVAVKPDHSAYHRW